jgi:hypothetical protein
MNAAARRVWARLPDGAREAIAGLPPTDLQTLLLSVAEERAAAVRPADLVRRWRSDRFVRPATVDPRRLAATEARMWALLPDEFDGVDLSPVVPLGTCAATAGVSQNRIVTTTRSAEVLSDATNALAVEAAARRRTGPGEIHLAAAHRHLRAQRFAPGMSAHFRLFVLVSSARDTGSGATEARLLGLHLAYWQRVLAEFAPAAEIRYTVFDRPVLRERIDDTVRPAIRLIEEPDRERGRGYYRDVALRITDGDTELGDGGFTSWTAELTSNAKERCLVSCLSTERLTG